MSAKRPDYLISLHPFTGGTSDNTWKTTHRETLHWAEWSTASFMSPTTTWHSLGGADWGVLADGYMINFKRSWVAFHFPEGGAAFQSASPLRYAH